jgi:hypothetical protein
LTDLHPASARPTDPVGTAEAAVTLLRTGRTSMALPVLEDLPDLIGAAIAAAKPTPTALQLAEAELARVRVHVRLPVAEVARLRGERRQAEADLACRRRQVAKLDLAMTERRRALERLARPAERCTEQRSPKPHELLSAAVAVGRFTAERVAELPGLQPRDIGLIASGKIGLAEGAWRRVLREIKA